MHSVPRDVTLPSLDTCSQTAGLPCCLAGRVAGGLDRLVAKAKQADSCASRKNVAQRSKAFAVFVAWQGRECLLLFCLGYLAV